MKHNDVSDKLPSNCRIVVGGDEHFRVPGFADGTAEAEKRYIRAHKHTYWLSLGDQIDFMNPQDKRFRLRLQRKKGVDPKDPWQSRPLFDRAQDQWEGFLDYFDSIGDKCLSVSIGNHEDRIMNMVNVAALIAKKWNCDWATPMSILKLPGFSMWLWHPFRFSMNLSAGDPQQRLANECMRIRRAMRYKPGSPQCQISVMAHIHKIRISGPQISNILHVVDKKGTDELGTLYPTPQPSIDPKTGQEYWHEDHKWFCSTGALFGSAVEDDYTYQETHNYDPTELGWLVVHIKNDKLVDVTQYPKR